MILVDIDFMNLGDLDEVLEIEKRCFRFPWSEETFRRDLEDRDSVYIVARFMGKVVGYAGIRFYQRQGHITTIAVAPRWRGNQIGEQLLLALLEIAKDKKAKSVVLEVKPTNLPARNLYEKYGFKPVGIIPGYYRREGADAIIMRLEI